MQLLEYLIVTAVMAVGTTASAILRNGDKVARQSAQCEIPPADMCQPSGKPMECNFCCFDFNPGAWSVCHQHGHTACLDAGMIWHCESHV